MKITNRQLRKTIREILDEHHSAFQRLSEAVGEAYFITDFGAPIPIDPNAGDNAELGFDELPRYGVWGDTGRGKPQVIDSGNDLEALLAKYGQHLKVTKI